MDASEPTPPAPRLPPTPPAVVSPAPAPTMLPLTYVVNVPHGVAGGPAITQVAMSDRVARSGAPYLVIVTTTLDVTGVTVEAWGQHFALFPAGPGRFGVQGQIPPIPWLIANRMLPVRLVATTADGRTSTASLEVGVGR